MMLLLMVMSIVLSMSAFRMHCPGGFGGGFPACEGEVGATMGTPRRPALVAASAREVRAILYKKITTPAADKQSTNSVMPHFVDEYTLRVNYLRSGSALTKSPPTANKSRLTLRATGVA